jgi:hypothetical protein
MLRHPWNRLVSQFHYFLSNPSTDLLAPEIETTVMLQNVTNIRDFITYPGIANCMTKLLNGIQCGVNMDLTEQHGAYARGVLASMAGFGLTEKFNSSVCLFYWMYGGEIRNHYFSSFREGSYEKLPIEKALSKEDIDVFRHSERFDLDLYQFADELFLHRMQMTECIV